MTVEGPRTDAPGAPAGERFAETPPPLDPAEAGGDVVGGSSLPSERLVGPEAAEGSDDDVTWASDDVEAEEGAHSGG